MGKMFDKKFVAGIVFGAVTFMAFSVNADITYNSEGVLYKKGNSNVVLKDELDNLNSYINYGNTTATDVLAGKTFVSSGKKVTGTMVNRGAVTSTLNAGGSYTIPAGYHNGSGKITAATLASQTSATATAGDIINGKTAWVNGSKITGTAKTYNEGYTDGKAQGGNWTAVFEVKGHFQNWENQVTWGKGNKGNAYYFTITVTAKCVNGTVTTSYTQSRTNGSTIVQFHYGEYYMGESNPYYDWKGVDWYLDSVTLKSYTKN